MRTQSRLLVALAALLLLLVYRFPLWTIELKAPQYPDGIGMHIFVDDIRGHDEHDIQNINILNHYIGMRPIDPQDFGELQIMPVVLAVVVVLALLAAVVGRLWLVAVWVVAFGVLGLSGMAVFQYWLYDFGHNLSPDAPIKVPGLAYSPPLLGYNRVVNITASSFPHLGAALLLAAAAIGLFVLYRERALRRREARP